MALDTHTISGNILDATGLPFGANLVQVVATPLTSSQAFTDSVSALLGSVTVNVPPDGALSLDLTEGPWQIKVDTYAQIAGRKAFQPIVVETNVDDDTTWGVLIATATDLITVAPVLDLINDIAAAVTGYTADSYAGAVTLPASGLHALDLTGDTTVTLTGDNGSSVLLDVVLNGHALAVQGVTVEDDGPVQCYRARDAWQVYPYGGTSGGGTTPDPSDTTAPTAPTLTVDNSSQTQLVASFSGGTDNVGVTRYRTRIDGGSWTTATSAGSRTFTGLTAGTSHTIDAQAGDAAGNWSTSTSVTKSTANASTPATWQTIATDSFTDPDGTALTSHAASTGATWTLVTGSDMTITGNKAVGPAGAQSIQQLDTGAFHQGGLRVSAVIDGGNYPALLIGYHSDAYGDGYTCGIEMSPSGSTYTITGKGAGADNLMLTGTLTGHPFGATFTVQINADASMIVKVNGTQVATGTIPGSLLGRRVQLSAYSAATFDDLLVEAYL